MPRLVDAIAMKKGSTSVEFLSTDGEHGPVVSVPYSTTLAATVSNYGLSVLVQSTASTGVMRVKMDAPKAGVEKTFYMDRVHDSSNHWIVELGPTTTVRAISFVPTTADMTYATTHRAIRFETSDAGDKAIAFRGVSNTKWMQLTKPTAGVVYQST